ncbi:death-on-curing family protein [Leucobacter insecticola]|uniref:Death-on-curing family protein n=1 Tax=Leucobacter insecticola TaxID=2714934 RepID=A0A6G8FKW2_9MICO|nr:RhuM family protein [Leucobacter insecticola]QIM16712.1 death-on-curing family protein [Leucobacter insecticola]
MDTELTGVVLYTSADGSISLEVRTEADTVWLTQAQIVELFDSSKANVSEHITNIFAEGELSASATVRKFRTVRTEGKRTVERELTHYNLDLVLSVGYRVKSAIATQFRIWATQRLREYLMQGYAVNEQRLEQLGQVVQILARSSDEVLAGVADVLAEYVPGLTLLRDYDEASLNPKPHAVPGWELTLEEARQVIQRVAAEFPGDGLLGNERGDGLAGIVATIYQGFGGQDLYPTVEEKAANLLYLIVKDHPLSDGNKRSAAALFVTFLARNGILRRAGESPNITNNTLAAITLMVAMSDPKEKELMVELIVRMLSEAHA